MAVNPVLNQLLIQSIQAQCPSTSTTNGAALSSATSSAAPAVTVIDPTSPEPAPSRVAPMDPERRKWLEEAISDLTYDVCEHMRKCIKVISDPAANGDTKVCEALQSLQFECEQIDAASDLHKLGGLKPTIDLLLATTNSEVRMNCAYLLATCINHNPEVQRQVRPFDLMPKFLQLLADETDVETEQKLLLCVSAMVRDNQGDPQALPKFVSLGGYRTLGNLCRSSRNNGKIRCKAVFLLFSLLSQLDKKEAEEIALKNELLEIMKDTLASLVADRKTINPDEIEATVIQGALQTLGLLVPVSPDVLKAAHACGLPAVLRQVEACVATNKNLVELLSEALPKTAHYQVCP